MRRQVKQIHAHALRNSLDLTQLILEKLLAVGDLRYAHSFLISIPTPSNTFLYNRLLQSYLKFAGGSDGRRASFPDLAFSLYYHMRRHDCPPNLYTFTSLFSLCAALALPLQGQSLHSQFIRMGYELDAHVTTSMVDMYSKTGLLGSARRVFDGAPIRDTPSWNAMISGYARRGQMMDARDLFDAMPVAERSVVSWTSMVSGYAHNGMHQEAVDVFVKMRGDTGSRRAAPNEVTVASVLPSCGSLGALELGRRIEEYARGRRFERNPYVANALLEMYAKCGSIDDARRVFVEMTGDGKGRRVNSRNLCSWNTMITGLAVNSGWEEALELFREMQAEGVNPDDITFVGVLLACTHGGLVDEGRRVYESMEARFSIRPKLEHYGCMVDLLGRAGLVREAYALVQSMPAEPDAVIWGTLLAACGFLGEKEKEEVVDIAEVAADFLFQLEPWNAGNYVILSNVYASCGRWDKVAEVWKGMKKGSPRRKSAGYSCLEMDGEINKFLVEDKSHPKAEEIYELVDEIHRRMMARKDDMFDLFQELSK